MARKSKDGSHVDDSAEDVQDQATPEKSVPADKKCGKVIAIVPHRYQIYMDAHRMIIVNPGTQMLDEEIVDHQWSKLNGVVRFEASTE